MEGHGGPCNVMKSPLHLHPKNLSLYLERTPRGRPAMWLAGSVLALDRQE